MAKQIAITEYPDVKVSSGGEVVELTFEQLALKCSRAEQGGKHGTFFVRGALDPPERKKANLKESKLLVIDGDCSLDNSESAPPADKLNEILTSWDVKHFIYTTHSAKADKHKWRCVIQCELESEDHLKIASKLICDKLNEFDFPIQWVKEMGSWIQPWFYPRRDDPADGVFEFYAHMDGTPLEIEYTKNETEKESKSKTQASSDSTSWKHKIMAIASSENYHQALVDITWGAIKDNADPALIRAMAETAMEMVPLEKRDERWSERYDDIGRIITEGISKLKRQMEDDADDLEIPDIPPPVFNSNLPMPKGYLGQLVQSVYDNQYYQYEELALVTALGLVSGIAGRRYNVSGTGLNLYLTLIMGTGMGKDSINEYMEQIMVSLNHTSLQALPMSFLGASRFTGPKALYGGLKNALSQVCVFTEAGLLLSGKMGDQAGLTRALLSLYTLSGKGRFSKPELFSSDDNSIAMLQSPALSIINEATPETLLQAFKDTNAIETGDLPRQSIFRINRAKPYANPNKKFEVSDSLSKRLSELVNECSLIQTEEAHEVTTVMYHPDIVEDIKAHDNMWIDRYNREADVNTLAANMSTRMHLKALKFAAVASVMNRTDNIITVDEWEWAKALVDYEWKGIDKFFAGSGPNEIDASLFLVARTVANMLSGTYKTPKGSLDKRYRDRKIVTRSAMKQAMKNNKKIREFDHAKYGKVIHGMDILLTKMVEDGLLKEIDDPFANKTGCLQITKEFKHVFGEYYDVD